MFISSVAIVDADNNGIPDIVAADDYTVGVGADDTLTVFGNDGTGHFSAGTNITVGSYPLFVTSADMNGDGWPDLVSIAGGGVSVLLNDTHGNFNVFQTNALPSSASEPTAVAPINLFGNGNLGLGVACGGEVLLLTNNGTGKLGSNSILALGNVPYYVAAGNFTGAPGQQLVCDFDLSGVQNSDNDYIVLFAPSGTNLLASNALCRVGPEPKVILAADINGDGSDDLVILDSQSSAVATFLNEGEGLFASNATYNAGVLPEAIALADINGDGSPDLIITGSGSPAIITLMTNNGRGVFGFYATIPVYLSAAAEAIAAGDVNGDGKPDLVATFSDGSMVVLINTISFPERGLAIQLVNQTLMLTWAGSASLQATPSLNIAFTNVPGAISPYTITPNTSQKFFRLKEN